jgi:hypothetical protein
MSDQLKEALDWLPNGWRNLTDDQLDLIGNAACAWSEFPTPQQVEAAAKAMVEIAFSANDGVLEADRQMARAALEAAHKEDR